MIVAACVLVVALIFGAAAVVWRSAPLRRRLRSRLLVTLKSGASFDGVLFSAGRSVWVLRNAQALGAGDNGATVPVDGEVLIFVSDIEYAQKP